MSKYTKIDIFLIIGFLVSAFAFSLTISNAYSKYNKVVEMNEFNKNYKTLNVNLINENKSEDNNIRKKDVKNMNLSEIISEIQGIGYKKIILSPLETQIEVGNHYYINQIWPCSAGIDIRSQNIIKGRYLTEEELNSNEKVAVIGFGLERLIEEKNGKNYIKVFDEYYKVIGILGNTEVFKYSSIIPIKSFYFIDKPMAKVDFWENCTDNTNIKENDSNINIIETDIQKIPIVKYLFRNVYELKNSLYQVIIGITNLLLFSYFSAKSMRQKVAIMKVLGGKNKDIFKEIFLKFIKVASIGIIGGLILSNFTIKFYETIIYV